MVTFEILSCGDVVEQETQTRPAAALFFGDFDDRLPWLFLM
jgi:hypothetical protein